MPGYPPDPARPFVGTGVLEVLAGALLLGFGLSQRAWAAKLKLQRTAQGTWTAGFGVRF